MRPQRDGPVMHRQALGGLGLIQLGLGKFSRQAMFDDLRSKKTHVIC